jgi:anti-sigma-K factor RskA
MNCEQVSELLPDYLQGNVNAEQDVVVKRHIELCADCRDAVAIWKNLSLLPDEQPSSALRERFEAMLRAYQAGCADQAGVSPAEQKHASAWRAIQWFRSPVAGLAWSIILLAIGVFAGHFMARVNSPDDLAAMRSELANMRQLVVLSMLQQQSASERLQGVSFSRREDQLDPGVLAALLHTLRYDASVDVRLAALDALSRHAGQPQVRAGISEALQSQQSPLVQVALIDQLAEWHDRASAQRLRDFQQAAGLLPAVRQRAEWALSKLQ